MGSDFDGNLDTTPEWAWSNNTDGGVIGGLDGDWTKIKWTLNQINLVDNWFFLSGNSSTKIPFSMDVDNMLTIKRSTPLPEPASILLVLIGLLVLSNLGRKIKS